MTRKDAEREAAAGFPPARTTAPMLCERNERSPTGCSADATTAERVRAAARSTRHRERGVPGAAGALDAGALRQSSGACFGAVLCPRIVAVALSALLPLLAHAHTRADDPPRSTDNSLVELSDTFGIDVARSEAPFEIPGLRGAVGKPAGLRDLERYVPLFVSEFSLYPKDLVKRSGLKRIVLCADLRYSDLSDSERVCLGLASYYPPTIYLNVSLGPWSPRYGRLTVHHEFFHLVDNADDGVIGNDKQWTSFNPRGFRYGGRFDGDEADADRAHTLRGFFTAYGATDIAEDKAEVFANLIVNGSLLAKRAKDDPYLRAKIVATKHALATFCPEIDDNFWEAALRLERPGGAPAISANDLAD